MSIEKIFSFLVPPADDEGNAKIAGVCVTEENSTLFGMLREVYSAADRECVIDVQFRQSDDGSQANSFRDLLRGYLATPTIDTGRQIAALLSQVTTSRSGLGLLFLILGKERARPRIVISRFPANNGIVANTRNNGGELEVSYLEQVFMKSAKAYKAAVYAGSYPAVGKVVDKQINSSVADVSAYWIRGFLCSDFRTTDAAGTRRVAEALRASLAAAQTPAEKTQLVAATLLTRNLSDVVSIEILLKRLGLSAPTAALVRDQVRDERLRNESFRIDVEEFDRQLPFRNVVLDSGAVLSAKTGDFEKVFTEVPIGDGRLRFVAEGQVVDQRLRKAQP